MKTTFKLNKELYDKKTIFKAAYSFTDIAYIHLDMDDDYFVVDIEMKADNNVLSEKDFVNELLTQKVREYINADTKNIRELIMARAYASTIVEKSPREEIDHEDDVDIDAILKDWFENEQS